MKVFKHAKTGEFLNKMSAMGASMDEIFASAPEDTALGQVQALADAIRKGRPLLSQSAARGEAFLLRPELLDQVHEEMR